MKTNYTPSISNEIEQKLKEIGEKVKSHRKKISNNYEDFASKHKINKVTLKRIENGKNYNMRSFLHVMMAIQSDSSITFEQLLK